MSLIISVHRPSLTSDIPVGMLPWHNAPVVDTTITNAHIVPLVVSPMVNFIAGPHRILPHYPAWSASRIRRSRSRSQSVKRALSPPSAHVKPWVPVPRLRQAVAAAQSNNWRKQLRVSPNALSLASPPPPLRPLPQLHPPHLNPQSPSPVAAAQSRPGPSSSSSTASHLPETLPTHPLFGPPIYYRRSPPHSLELITPALPLSEDDEDLFALDEGEDKGKGKGKGGEWEEGSRSGAPALRLSSLSMEEFERERAADSDSDSDGGTSLWLVPPRRAKPPSSVGAETGSSVAVQTSSEEGEGKGKEREREEPARKRTRSPSEDGSGGEDEDVRPAKVCRFLLGNPSYFSHYLVAEVKEAVEVEKLQPFHKLTVWQSKKRWAPRS